MPHIHKKVKNGRPYYYFREIARVDGKPKVINQVYLGSPQRLLEMAQSTDSACVSLQVQEFGALWLANLIEQEIGLAQIVDQVIPRSQKETGPSVGEYFLYAIFNRMVDARSKNELPAWYAKTAIQHIRPTTVNKLDSQHYWKKWERVSEVDLQEIARRFFQKCAEIDPPAGECVAFDTTNYYTCMSSSTESELAQRGKNKDGKDWLRQVGVALLVSRENRLPLYYHEYEGNRHDSKVFAALLEDITSATRRITKSTAAVTVVFDKGMNSVDNFALLDSLDDIRFITSYSTYYSEELVQVPLDIFQPVLTEKNVRLAESGKEDDRIVSWRTTGEYWGRERTVVVTYNPRTATRQRYAFDRKMLKLQSVLFEMQENVQQQKAHWKNKAVVRSRYEDVCRELHLPSDLYTIDLSLIEKRLSLTFRKNHYRIKKHINRFGKNILITNNMAWSTDNIVRASLDRYCVEQSFRQSKDQDLVSLMPLRHWTDGKIRCHIFTCIAALSYLCLLENKMRKSGLELTANHIMDKMHNLHSCLVYRKKVGKPERVIEEPDSAQAAILKAAGYAVRNGVLQDISL